MVILHYMITCDDDS